MNPVNKFLINSLIKYLKSVDIIDKVYFKKKSIHVLYSSGNKERWSIFKTKNKQSINIDWDNLFGCNELIKNQYNKEIINNEIMGKYKIILYKDYINSPFICQRLAINRYICNLLNSEWLGVEYPAQYLNKFIDIKYKVIDKNLNNIVLPSGNSDKSNPIINQYLRFYENSIYRRNSVKNLFTNVSVLVSSINRCLKSKKDINIYNICDFINSWKKNGIRRLSPLFWGYFYKKLNIDNKSRILDLEFGFGSKFLFLKDKIDDYYVNSISTEADKFSKFYGKNLKLNDNKKFDVVFISDYHLLKVDEIIKRIKNYNSIGDMLIGFVKYSDYDKLKLFKEPKYKYILYSYSTRIKISDDYHKIVLFIYDNRKLEYTRWQSNII